MPLATTVCRSRPAFPLIASLLTLTLALALASLPMAAQAQGSAGSHAAITFSPSFFISPEGAARGYGVSWGWGSRRDAERRAIRDCTNNDPIVTDCRVMLSFSRGCGAMAVGIRGVSSAPSTATGRSRRAAEAAALDACNRNAANCRMVVATCAASRGAP